jgi:hypothetical protein
MMTKRAEQMVLRVEAGVYLAAEAALERARRAIENADQINDGFVRGFGELGTSIQGMPANLVQDLAKRWEQLAVRLMRNPLSLRNGSWNQREAISGLYLAVAARLGKEVAPETAAACSTRS